MNYRYMNKRSLFFVLLTAVAVAGYAQGGTKSPYSQYGLGALADQSQGFSRGMGGVGLALRRGNIANSLNPAAYSAIDSLTMIFDVGMSGQLTNYEENGTRVNASGANFEYAVGTFRLMPNVGVSFGLLPFSNIGYDYTAENFLDTSNGTIYEAYSGSGGMRQVFVGAGWLIAKPLSVGVNMGYLWGSYTRSVTTSTSTGTSSYINSLSKVCTASVSSYNLQVGLQWEQRLGKKDAVTLGATMTLGHKLGSDPEYMIINSNTLTSNRDTTTLVAHNGLSLPTTYGAGAAWNHQDKLTVEADVTLQKWGGIDMPDYDSSTHSYAQRSGLLKDRWKVALGADYVPDQQSRKYLNRVHYRMGASYATPYYYINRQDGPKELSVSAGFGLPLQNSWNTRANMRPVLNISAQWAHASAKDLIAENTFRINIGLTFNERWFAKWKVD